MLRDFLSFLRAVWHEWQVLLTGGSIIALLAAWSMATGKAPPQSVTWLVLGLTLMLAAFLAWRKEWILNGSGFIDADSVCLSNIFRNRTIIQGQLFAKSYLGKWMKVEGTVSEVEPWFGSVWVQLRVPVNFQTETGTQAENIYVSLSLSYWQARPFLAIPAGTLVRVAGRIRKLGPRSISLGAAELLEVKLP